ncbi:hypothetical protein PHLGIDRAFT_77815 [Phlebiopsis gigantea 11061_1 CR5-6]|uniref:Mitochondrial splicing suppressor 51-like C-terminal domain-containing protein n=1 Tax=Phlebiopsis gigantea (strain 11061_1 CR5-6) TaxID=745531 RepID=A0A0C3RSG8_PHLG1|nr:hypothetical protein PHLGIDRAFT_77815 [Phlebiopsis gigantea 11061_1 CR5-6]
MSFPMSVYHLIVERLKITSPAAASAGKREQLNILLLGAEVELNFVPLFSELALLLPHHDVSVVMWGYCVHKLVQESKTQGVTGSPVRDAAGKHGLVFEYRAPDDLGAGAVSVYLKGEAPTWGKADLEKALAARGNHPHLTPDVIIALNAGLGSYRSWYEVISIAHGVDIPFAVTEYLQQSLEFTVKYVVRALMFWRSHDITYNPFHRPGQRPFASYKMPNLVNGFSLVVVNNK